METIKKRFHTFVDSSMPVIAHYKAIGKVLYTLNSTPQTLDL
jgi:hypothetical protein